MIKNDFFRNGFLLVLGLIVSHSFGDSTLSPYETVRLTPASVKEQIQLANEKVQNDSSLSEDIKNLVHAYTEVITKCSVDHHNLNNNAVVHALIGVYAYHFAVNEPPEEQSVFFEFMSDLEEGLSGNLDCSLENHALAKIHTRVHINSTIVFPVEEEGSNEEFEITDNITFRPDRMTLIDKLKDMGVPTTFILQQVSARQPLW